MKRSTHHNSAWVITLEGTQQPCEVVALMSAQVGVDAVGDFLERLYPLLELLPSSAFDAAAYNGSPPCAAERGTTETGVHLDTIMHCGWNPWLTAVKATGVRFDVNDTDIQEKDARLHWTTPKRKIRDANNNVVSELPGVKLDAPFRSLHVRR